MPRRTFKRWLPSAAKVKNSKSLQFLGHFLHEPGLWHLNRKSVTKAFFFGLFLAMIPVPSQMLLATMAAIYWNANLPLSLSLVWVTNPLTMPPIFYFNYMLGNWILGSPTSLKEFHFSVEWILSQINAIWWPLLLGSIIVGLFAGVIGAFSISQFWHWHVRTNWRRRQQNRLPAKINNQD